MSTLKVTNIQATGETASRAVSGVAAVWVNFNGSGTIAARDSENVSSLTDRGTGEYSINIANDMSDANYSYVASIRNNVGIAAGVPILSGQAAGRMDINCEETNDFGLYDPVVICSHAMGDLA